VDQLAWAATDREVARYVRSAGSPDSVFAQALGDGHAAHGSTLDRPVVYAVEATALDRGIDAGVALFVRTAAMVRNPSRKPIERLVFRIFPAGQEYPGGAHVRGVWVDGEPTPWLLDQTLLEVPLGRRLRPGKMARVLIEMAVDPPLIDPRMGNPDRYNAENTGVFGQADGVVNLGHLVPVLTKLDEDGTPDRRSLPSTGEPAMGRPGLYHVHLDAPAGLTAMMTGSEIARETDGVRNGLVSVASGVRTFAVELARGYRVTTAQVGTVRLRVAHPSDEVAMGAHLLDYGQRSLAFYNNHFGALPYREVDIVEAPVVLGAGSEFPGLVTADVRHKVATYRKSASHEWYVAHEIAHQWWYSEVGTDPAEEPWLDEALASHSALLYWEDRYGRDAAEAILEREVIEPTRLAQEQGLTDLPANLQAARYDSVRYGVIIYGRALMFLDRVVREMGRENYLGALRAFYAERHCTTVSGEDFLSYLRRYASEPDAVDALHQRWIVEAHGYEDVLAE